MPKDIWVIERDERDVGGRLQPIARYENWDCARDAWNSLPPDERLDVQLWLCRLNDGIDDPAHTVVLECKQKGDAR